MIGFVGAAQWNSSLARQEFVTSAQRVLITEAEQLQRQQEALRAEIEEAEDRVRTFQERSEGSRSELEALNAALAVARLASGLDEVRGPGAVIEIADSQRPVPAGESPTNYIVLVDDIRDIVTALWASGAEAITIAGGAAEGVSPPSGWSRPPPSTVSGSSILVNTPSCRRPSGSRRSARTGSTIGSSPTRATWRGWRAASMPTGSSSPARRATS